MILDELKWRGLIHQCTDEKELGDYLSKPQSLYVGFDPTATSLHVGSLLPLMMLRRFQSFGHKPIALVGGATGMIGDPSGKSKERNLQTKDELEANVQGLRKQMQQFLDFSGSSAAILVNNLDWTGPWSYLEFLRDVGKNFPVSVMLSKDSVKSRIERDGVGISYTEFSYMLLQAYDFVHLSRTYGCKLQVGGSDQWGNITAGIDLARRMDGVSLIGMTCPLLLNSEGKKMGKTEDGTVWLDGQRTSPYAFYQYWKNIDDRDVMTCVKYLTEINREEATSMEETMATDPRAPKQRLAEWLTEFVHGRSGLDSALNASAMLFSGKEISNLRDAEVLEIFSNVLIVEMPRTRLSQGLLLIDALVESTLASSKSEARRTIEQNGAYINNRPASGLDRTLTESDLASESVIVLRSGKKKYAILRFI